MSLVRALAHSSLRGVKVPLLAQILAARRISAPSGGRLKRRLNGAPQTGGGRLEDVAVGGCVLLAGKDAAFRYFLRAHWMKLFCLVGRDSNRELELKRPGFLLNSNRGSLPPRKLLPKGAKGVLVCFFFRLHPQKWAGVPLGFPSKNQNPKGGTNSYNDEPPACRLNGVCDFERGGAFGVPAQSQGHG